MESLTTHRGFTLIELLVVLAIIMVITGVTLTSQSSFNRTLIVSNTAYDLALTLRSAETYGISSRASGTLANAGYGIDFQKATPGSFTLFVDKYPTPGAATCHPTADATAPDAAPGNCVYEAAQGEKVLAYTLGNAVTISDFCAYAAGAWSCASGSATSLDIVFSRPNATAFMSLNGVYSSVSPVTSACIKLSAPSGQPRFVAVNLAGRITANATSCP